MDENRRTYSIIALFGGTGSDLPEDPRWKEVTVNGKKIEHVVKRKRDDYCHFFAFEGAGLFNLSSTNVKSTVERAKTVLSNEITDILAREDCNKIYVEVIGHSRGGAAASGAVRLLKTWVQGEVPEHNRGKVVITFAATDPYYGPTAKNEYASTSMRDIEGNDPNHLPNVVVYSTKTKFACTPQQITNTDVVIIAHCGHNETVDVHNEWEDLIFDECFDKMRNQIVITDAEKEILARSKVLWAVPRMESVTIPENRIVNGNKFRFVAVDKTNVKDLMRCIRKYGPRHFCDRVKVLATVVRKRLKIKLSDENIAEWMPQWTKDLENCLENIDRSRTASEAFNYVFELLNDDKYGLFISKNKDKAINFWYVVKGSYDLVLCGENEQALVVMRDYIKRGPQEFKKRILQKLMQRISEK